MKLLASISAAFMLSNMALAQETPAAAEYVMANETTYTDATGHGFDFGTSPAKDGSRPFFFSTKVPDGNYVVTVTLGDKKRDAETTVRAESRRLMLDREQTKKGKPVTRTFIVNKRNPDIDGKDSVRLNKREIGINTWDDKLTLEFTGASPAVQSISIRPVEESDSVTTVFICGDSTVVDQANEPYASWGQMIPLWFDESIAVSNHAESGERTTSFMSRRRLDKVLSMAKPGDWILIEFGHNDEKDKGPGSGAWYNYTTNLKIFIDKARAAGLNPVLITPTARRFFDENGKIKNTHGDYPEAMKMVAQRENVPLIDLTPMVTTLFEALGTEGSKKSLVHYPANTFAGQEKALADNTHFNPYGAYEVAKCVMEGMRENVPELFRHLRVTEKFDPATPDNPEEFVWVLAPNIDLEKPYGN